MAELNGFWSYVHADDQAEGDRISQLARDVVNQFELLTGESISLFLDKDAIHWGDDWRRKIESNLATVAFFVPVLTPRYFMSAECRRELWFFAQRASALGVKELVLPLLYVDVPALHDEANTDDLIALVRTFQWEDWQELRFSATTSEDYRRGVARLAARLVEANKRAEKEGVTADVLSVQDPSTDATDDSPGVIDRLAQAEETLPEWNATLENIGREIESIGKLLRESTTEMTTQNSQGRGFAGRVRVARRLAQSLGEPVERIWSFGNLFVTQLHNVDTGFRTLIEAAAAEVENSPDSRATICEFFASIRRMAAAAAEMFSSIQVMTDTFAPLERMSRDLRPALRRLRQGLTTMTEAHEVMAEWVRLVDETGINCGDGVNS